MPDVSLAGAGRPCSATRLDIMRLTVLRLTDSCAPGYKRAGYLQVSALKEKNAKQYNTALGCRRWFRSRCLNHRPSGSTHVSRLKFELAVHSSVWTVEYWPLRNWRDTVRLIGNAALGRFLDGSEGEGEKWATTHPRLHGLFVGNSLACCETERLRSTCASAPSKIKMPPGAKGCKRKRGKHDQNTGRGRP